MTAPRLPSNGVVREWNVTRMQGVIDSPDTPDGCFTLWNTVAIAGFPRLNAGDRVTFEWYELDEPVLGYKFHTVRVWPAGSEPTKRAEPNGPFVGRLWSVPNEELDG